MEPFAPYLTRWQLVPDGGPIVTPSSDLLPVLQSGIPAILKIPRVEEERIGGRLMVWWQGDGAAKVLAEDEGVLLLERATGTDSLSEMSENGEDAEAARIVCAVAAKLHKTRNPPPTLVSLGRWFRDLEPAAQTHGGILRESSKAAQVLLTDPQDITVLHGDLHHGNVLDFSEKGWLAIDPKGLLGERGFDFANLFCNPDEPIATAPGRLARLANVVSAAASLDRRRLLQWVLAYTGLSAAWSMQDGDDPRLALSVAELAYAELGT